MKTGFLEQDSALLLFFLNERPQSHRCDVNLIAKVKCVETVSTNW